ncbi:ABC transporter substrate-binding protein [Rhodospirillum sp. A1_3_36]|uniref:ABC transporter substrate-binding protein n=1 Tax=Rhodospirillum sp. A1_3_36 TaxID=3391666 RepID=UPI0039A6B08B
MSVDIRRPISMARRWGPRALVVGALALFSTASSAAEPVKLGLMLPYTGTYAALGEAITNGLKLAIEQSGNRLGGREVEYVVVDSEANPGKAPQNMNRLVVGDKADVIIGPVHSGVAMGMLKVARQEGALMIIPNAGLNVATRQLCAPNIFRTSFSAWQTAYPMGQMAYDRGFRKVVTIAWKYSFGTESLEAFEESFKAAGGEVVKQILTPFPEVEFQSYLTEIASLKPDAVFAFYAGGGAVKFVKDYAAAGLKDSIPLMGSGFLTDGTLKAQGDAATGVLTTLHYADGLDNPTNTAFRKAYADAYGTQADIYAVQGYDTGLLLVKAFAAVNGATDDQKALIAAMEGAWIDSPRGAWIFSKAHNPIQPVYLREVQNGANVVLRVAGEAVNDPATGCAMAE